MIGIRLVNMLMSGLSGNCNDAPIAVVSVLLVLRGIECMNDIQSLDFWAAFSRFSSENSNPW